MARTWRAELEQTLDDYRVSRSEKKALQGLLGESELSDSDIHLLRSEAFDVARVATESPETINTLEWLEEVVRLLAQADNRVGAPTSSSTSGGRAYFSPGLHCLEAICEQIKDARHSLEICVFTITDNRITTTIEDAVRRRINVRVISDDMKSGDRGSDVGRLSAAGADVRIDRSRHHMHHKFAIVDNKTLLTGSYNWTRSAADHNEENLIILQDKQMTTRFQKEFKDLWERCADWIDE